MRKNIMEVIGTYFLLLAISFTGNPLAIGLMLAVMVYAGGHISGAHYNPAVTIAFLCRREMDLKQGVAYWISQLIGALLAALTYCFVFQKSFVPAPGEGHSFLVCVVIEAICTFALAFVILTVATGKKLEGNFIYGLAIGLTLAAIAFTGGPVTGGVYNPAVFIGPMLIELLSGGNSLGTLLLYIIGPAIGGVAAAYLFGYLNEQ